jgi:SAM-dependent MidA family methyltransferase
VKLREKIVREIAERGPIPFSRYMELCLYDPELGYYSRHLERFGKAGDFYTSSDVHAVFGRLLVRQFEEIWRLLGSPLKIEILELGPGRGLFAQDVLDWSEKKFPQFYTSLHYTLVEISAALREKLQARLATHVQAGKVSLGGMGGRTGNDSDSATTRQPQVSGSPAVADVPVIIFANEFFDALPVEILSSEGELRIDLRDGALAEVWVPASAGELEFLNRYSWHPKSGERVEVPLLAQCYASQITEVAQRGFLIAIDYGYTRHELLAGRHRDTIMAYRQHSASAHPYEAPGEQDLTAHVNFTAIAAAAEQGGMHAQPLLTQSQFLLGIGERNQFADAFEECRLPQERAKVALQLKHLVTPAGMGESFRVLVASKGVDPEEVASLSGLSFGKRGCETTAPAT